MSLTAAAGWAPDRLWGAIVSSCLHLVMIVLFVYLVPASPLREPAEEIVAVTIVRPAQPDPPADRTGPPEKAVGAPEMPGRIESTPPDWENAGSDHEAVSIGGMIEPAAMLSAGALSSPEALQARLALPSLQEYDRRLQLCGLEAMEQIQAWQDRYRPERLVAYAMKETRLRGNRVVAEGAAFRSKGRWYNLRFECDVTNDIGKVVSFRFAVGDPIPYGEWATHNLPAVH